MKQTVRSVVMFVFAAGAGLGAWGHHTWSEEARTQLRIEANKPPVLKESVRTVTDTKIRYVPGETVHIPVPGRPGDPPEAVRLDGKFVVGKPEFVYSLNGKPGTFTRADDEAYVFDKNMIQMTQATRIKIEAEVPTIDKTRYFGVGPMITTESAGMVVSRETGGHRFMLMAGKKWDGKNGRGYEAGFAWQIKL